MSNKETHRSVCLSMENFQKLASLGQVPESINTIVSRLLDEHYSGMMLKRKKSNAVGAAELITK